MVLVLELLVILGLTVVNGLLAMAELAVVSARRVRLREAARQGSHGAAVALHLIAHPGRFLSTVQIGITLVGVLAGAFGGATLAGRLGAWLDRWLAPHGDTVAIGVVVLAISYLSLVVGELVPKRLALGHPERMAALVAPAMDRLSRLAAPAVWLLDLSSGVLLRLLGPPERRPAVTESEVRALIAEGTRLGVFVPRERDMIEGVLRLADRTVRALMTPRPEVAWLDLHADREVIAATLRRARFSRFPVCDGAVDHAIGIVHTKDLVRLLLDGDPIDLGRCMAQPLVVLEQTPALGLLERFRAERIHMAIVVDELGDLRGVATPTDLLEAIAGDLPELGEPAAPALIPLAGGGWLVDGSLAIDEFADRTGLGSLGGDGYTTVAGFVLHRLGHLPAAGESFVHAGARFEIVALDGRRIDKVAVRPAPPAGG